MDILNQYRYAEKYKECANKFIHVKELNDIVYEYLYSPTNRIYLVTKNITDFSQHNEKLLYLDNNFCDLNKNLYRDLIFRNNKLTMVNDYHFGEIFRTVYFLGTFKFIYDRANKIFSLNDSLIDHNLFSSENLHNAKEHIKKNYSGILKIANEELKFVRPCILQIFADGFCIDSVEVNLFAM